MSALSTRIRPKRKRNCMAARADRHALYERAVQDPETDVVVLSELFRSYRRREAMHLREDFCGTAALATAWVRSRPGRTATGIDLDQETMDWGRAHQLAPAGEDVARRVDLRCANVLDGVGSKADLTVALNFSYCVFHQRRDLLAYFRSVRRKLVDDGLFVLDLLGGWESMSETKNRRDVGDFVYRWDQRQFNPLTHQFLCAITFEFPDGSKLENAFHYEWRLWTCPELRDLLAEAGFSRVRALWGKTDKDGEETGEFYEPAEVDNQEAWWTYIVAER